MVSKKNIGEGDILLFTDGTMAQLLERHTPWDKNLSTVQYIDEREHTHTELKERWIVENLGSSPSVLATFHATRSLHLRLNGLKNV